MQSAQGYAHAHGGAPPRERDRDAQEIRYVQWPTKQSIGRRTAGILKHQRHAGTVRERFHSY